MGKLRDDLALAAYAVSLGFAVRGFSELSPAFPIGLPHYGADGIPADPLTFVLQHPNDDDIVVWSTARGWRVAQKRGGHCPLPQLHEFYTDLRLALEAAFEIRKEQSSDFSLAPRLFAIPVKSRLYRMSPEQLGDLLTTLDGLTTEISEARREAIHRLGGKSEHKRQASKES